MPDVDCAELAKKKDEASEKYEKALVGGKDAAALNKAQIRVSEIKRAMEREQSKSGFASDDEANTARRALASGERGLDALDRAVDDARERHERDERQLDAAEREWREAGERASDTAAQMLAYEQEQALAAEGMDRAVEENDATNYAYWQDQWEAAQAAKDGLQDTYDRHVREAEEADVKYHLLYDQEEESGRALERAESIRDDARTAQGDLNDRVNAWDRAETMKYELEEASDEAARLSDAGMAEQAKIDALLKESNAAFKAWDNHCNNPGGGGDAPGPEDEDEEEDEDEDDEEEAGDEESLRDVDSPPG